jgi:hypothetical protein
VTEKDGTAFLEWTSHGSIDGQAFDYDGVSVLESDDDRITAFRTYFDPATSRPPAPGAAMQRLARPANPPSTHRCHIFPDQPGRRNTWR